MSETGSWVLLEAASPDIPLWVLIFERIGFGAAVLIFVGAFTWRLLPPAAKLFQAWTKQSDKMTNTIPRIERSVERIADNMERGFEMLNSRVYPNESEGELRAERDRLRASSSRAGLARGGERGDLSEENEP